MNTAAKLRHLFPIQYGVPSGALDLGERATYPRWLAAGSLHAVSRESLCQLREQPCEGKSVWVFEKETEWVFRCGDFWPAQQDLPGAYSGRCE